MATTQIKDGYQGGTDNQLKVNADGSINVAGGGGVSYLTNIQDTNGNPINSTGGALDVTIVSTTGNPVNAYNEVTSVAMSSTVTVLTYTVPAGNRLNLSSVLVSSDSVSTIVLNINSAVAGKARLTYGNFNTVFNYANGTQLVAGSTVTVTATNNSAQGAASFNAQLQGALD